MSGTRGTQLKLPSIRRLPLYLRIAEKARLKGLTVVSSTYLAGELDIEAIVVKKDLEITAVRGKTGVGYLIEDLKDSIETFLGWKNINDAVLIGAGSLGSALLGYEGFLRYGIKFVAAFDNNPDKTDRKLRGIEVFPLSKMEPLIKRMHICTAALSVPAEFSQSICNRIISAGVYGIWNFTPVKLEVPPGIIVQNEDLSEGLAELSVKMQSITLVEGA